MESAALKTAMEASLAQRGAALGAERAAAFKAFARTGMPHRRMEAWKWTDLRAALREPLASVAPEGLIAPSIFAGVSPFELTLMNGELVAAASEQGAPPAGVRLTHAETPLSERAADHPLAELAAAFAPTPLNLSISGRVDRPILIRRVAGPGESQARMVVALKSGAEATIIESCEGTGAFFSNSVIEFLLAPGARLRRTVMQDGGDDGVETALATVTLGAGASFDQTSVLFGGKTTRIETRIAMAGEGAAAVINTAVALSGARHADATSLVRHEAPGGETRQIHRAALKGRSQGVFQGKFFVARGAQKTDAQMNAGALLLSDMAEANHKPELEIYADDVQCGHGSTAGALDENAIFYMRQRGLSADEARALLIEAFLAETFDAIPHAGIEHALRVRLSSWLEGA